MFLMHFCMVLFLKFFFFLVVKFFIAAHIQLRSVAAEPGMKFINFVFVFDPIRAIN